MKKSTWLLSGVIAAILGVVLYAQEPAMFERGISIVRGNLAIAGTSSSTISFEGSTADASETRILVTDPTADRDWTIPDSASDTFAGLAATQTLTNKTLDDWLETGEVVTATNVLTTADCGRAFYLNAVAGFLTTLPTPTLGCAFRFVVKAAPTSNGYTIDTASSSNIIYGMVEERAGTAGVACATEDLLTLVANQSIIGDWLEIRSDGTNWYVHGMTDVAAGFTCALT